MNSILAIHPYKIGEIWLFNDSNVGLLAEPLVGEINKFVDELSEDKLEVTIMFSDKKFPGYQLELTKLHEEFEGNWYQHPDGRSGWLCSALYLYYKEAPEKMYFQVIPR